MASDLLATIRSEIETRLDELRPLLAEYERLLAAADALAGSDGLATPAPHALAAPASVPAALDKPPGSIAPDEVAERPAPGEPFADNPDPGEVAGRTAPGESVAIPPPDAGVAAASSGDGTAAVSTDEAAVEAIADAAPSGYRGREARGTAAAEAIAPAVPGPTPSADEQKPRRADSASVQQAILAALGHGSHTLSELTMVTAMIGPDIRGGLNRLVARGSVTKTKRDGKTAYALSSAAAETPA